MFKIEIGGKALGPEVIDEINRDEAEIEEGDSTDFNFCKDCPLLGFDPDTIIGRELGVGWVASHPDTTLVSARFQSIKGEESKPILLGTHPGNSIGGKRVGKIVNDAAKQTHECQGPRRSPRVLGPFAVRKCSVLKDFTI